MKSRLSNAKNLIWATAILICLLALLLGLVFSMSRKSQGEREEGTIVLGQIERQKKNSRTLRGGHGECPNADPPAGEQ